MFGFLTTIASGIKNFLINIYWEVMATKLGEIITISNEKNYNYKKYQKQSLPVLEEITQTVHLPNNYEKASKHQHVLNISKEQGIHSSTIISYNLLDFITKMKSFNEFPKYDYSLIFLGTIMIFTVIILIQIKKKTIIKNNSVKKLKLLHQQQKSEGSVSIESIITIENGSNTKQQDKYQMYLASDFIAETPLLLKKITNVDKSGDIIISDPELGSDVTIETSKDIDLGTVKHFKFEDLEFKKEPTAKSKSNLSLEYQIDVPFFIPLCREEQKNDDISKSVRSFFLDLIELRISLNEKERNTNLENFLLKALNIKKKDASFLNTYMNKTILLKKNKTLSQKILSAYQDKDSFEALLQHNPEDKVSLVDELLFTHNVDSIKSILIALILIFKYKQPTSIYKATITSFFENLSVFLSKFKNTAFESKDLDLFHLYVIAIMDSISLSNKEKVEMVNLKKFIKTLMAISVSKNSLNDRSKEAFFCCCFIVCGLRFSNVIKFFDDLFPFKEIKKITNNESTIVKHSLFYLSLCKIILLNYIVKDIASMSDLDKFIKLLFTHLDLEFFQNNELLKNDLREIQYIQQFCSEHLNM
ncbi:hypothetical protein HANVADRAFT_118631 [Hanseniaspora valbyensis NRRL Y-1626]|uniref:Uncharacterized protein n=1 Tax=Hanseniaspora valbyensis NRRL Y-1626 TaxID=766949 RepID=A0A1B7TEZ3_9ASCO|nr:hypothetical protein HANVADRAFT_118631 [Hanseniaspora valbyensis NRRL Y-1626]